MDVAATRAAGKMRGRRYYMERAAYMRALAKTALTEALKASCLKAAAEYEALLKVAEEGAAARDAVRSDGAIRRL